MARPDELIFVSLENWDDVWRRNQFVCAELARRHPALRILFVGLPKNVSGALRRGALKSLLSPTTHPIPDFPTITATHPPKLFPDSLPTGRRLNESMFRRHVNRVARQMGFRRPVLWLNPHSAVHMAGRMNEALVVYDITDDWTTLTQSPRHARRTREDDSALCRRADATVVCSRRLFELKYGLTANLHLIPNGVHVEHYHSVLDASMPLPPEAVDWPKPVFGYTGTIHPDRIDVSLLENLGRTLTRGSLVLVGPNHLSPEVRGQLRRTGRLHFVDAVPYARIPDYMRAFDVLMTPHRVTPFTESLNPIKLWEYLAAGKPIVSTDVAGFRDFPHLVRIARTPSEFKNALVEALDEAPEKMPARRAEAGRHSWGARVDQVEAVIQSCLARGPEEVIHAR